MCLGKKRRTARHKKTHMAGAIGGQPGIVKKPRIEGWHTHHACSLRQNGKNRVNIKFRQKDHAGTRQQNNIGRDKQAMRMKNWQCM